jgi:hypothetical protein
MNEELAITIVLYQIYYQLDHNSLEWVQEDKGILQGDDKTIKKRLEL